MSGGSARDPIAAVLAGGERPGLVARIWATVDLDRALGTFGVPGERLADDPLLGAAVVLIRPIGGEAICLLEPNTEGRLAAGLARNGEGPAGSYVAALDDLDAVSVRAEADAISIRRAGAGPFGPCILVLDRPPAGPHLVLVEPSAGTIDR